MKTMKENKTPIVLLCCAFGIAAALLHWFVPTRILLGNGLEYACASVAAVLSLGALGLFVFGFAVPLLRKKQGLCGESVFYMPALCWSAIGLLFGACATAAKLIRALSYGFVPVQTDGAEYSFSVLMLVNVPVLVCFAALCLREQKLRRN